MFSKIPKRGTRITVSTLSNPDAAQGYYDANGKLVDPGSSNQKLWAKVMDKASASRSFGQQVRHGIDLALNVDARSAKNIEVGQQLTTDRDNKRYAVADIYEDEWKFSTVIIARYID